MSDIVLLGIDTGGTYTDAVIVTDEDVPQVLASAKALTTYHDLAIGIREAIGAVVVAAGETSGAGFDPTTIGLVSISTTLATNAIVEGHGGKVCLISMGFDAIDLTRGGLPEALRDGVTLTIAGGHTSHGDELAPLDLAELDRQLDGLAIDQFSGFAVAGQFAVRNAEHEQRVRTHLRGRFGPGVTCSHELSARLNGPKRAVTAVLNARLIGLVGDLVAATRSSMHHQFIDAPLMVVRGDGTLISAALAAERPIETILSGPAASVIGANHLVGGGATTPTDAIVADIGGTTTDLAVMSNGQVLVNPAGATVGGHATMVEAVDIRTVGLGGDSEVSVDDSGPITSLRLGPRRVIPVCLLASLHPDRIRPAIEQQLRSGAASRLAGTFAMLRRAAPERSRLSELERFVIDGVTEGPVPLRDLIPTNRHEIALTGLVRAGVIARSSFTPTDAAHILGLDNRFDIEAAGGAAELLARTQDRRGVSLADGATELATHVVELLRSRTVDAILGMALENDGFAVDAERHPLAVAGVDHHRGHVAIDVRLETMLIGLGASASTYYPEVARRLGTSIALPEHAAVANAVGAIVGKIQIKRQATITQKKNGTYVAAGGSFADLDAAIVHARVRLEAEVSELAEKAGADGIELTTERVDNVVLIGDQEFFVDATITVTGSGRPLRRSS
jgi:N-methylhydantoinase A/oxoprolinase/acetone carboxylase beta subunit